MKGAFMDSECICCGVSLQKTFWNSQLGGVFEHGLKQRVFAALAVFVLKLVLMLLLLLILMLM